MTLEARHRLAVELTPPTRESLSITEEPLSEHSIFRLEKIKRPELGMAGVVAHWGRKYERKEVDSIIAEKLGEKEVALDTGFSEIYRTPEQYTTEEVFFEEMTVVKRLVKSILQLNGWKPEQVDALFFAGSPLIKPDYGYAIAQNTGLTHLNPKTDIFNYYLTCNAGGQALREALTNPNLEGKNVVVIATEGLTKQTDGFNVEKADPLSLQFFSDGAAAIGVVPKISLTHLLGESKAVEDVKGALAAVEPWRELIDPEGELIQKVGNITLIRLPQPPEGMQIFMKGGETTKLFLRNVFPSIQRVYEQHREQYPEKDIKMIVAHHPSIGVNNLMKRRLEKKGISTPMPWVVNDGNSSGATTLIAFVRLMERFSPGDHVMIASFGAGISIDTFVIEIGEIGAKFFAKAEKQSGIARDFYEEILLPAVQEEDSEITPDRLWELISSYEEENEIKIHSITLENIAAESIARGKGPSFKWRKKAGRIIQKTFDIPKETFQWKIRVFGENR